MTDDTDLLFSSVTRLLFSNILQFIFCVQGFEIKKKGEELEGRLELDDDAVVLSC